MKRLVMFLVAFLVGLNAGARVIDLDYDYYVASTIDHAYSPDLHPDMDGDANEDLMNQQNIQTLVSVLADDASAQQGETLAAFEHNEAIARAGLQARFQTEALVTPLAELWAAYMSIQGEGSYQGPTRTGMAGRVETMWQMFGLADYAGIGPFEQQAWQKAPIFEPGEIVVPVLTVTGDGTVTQGDNVVFTASPSDASAYRWFKDDELIEGETTSTLVLESVTPDDAGAYFCELEIGGKATYTTPTVVLVVEVLDSVPLHFPATYGAILIILCLAMGLLGNRVTGRSH